MSLFGLGTSLELAVPSSFHVPEYRERAAHLLKVLLIEGLGSESFFPI